MGLPPGEWIALIALIVVVIGLLLEHIGRRREISRLDAMVTSFNTTVESFEKQVKLFRKEVRKANKAALQDPKVKELELAIEREKSERKRIEEEAKNKRELGRVVRKLLSK